jgi:hypothetical protein
MLFPYLLLDPSHLPDLERFLLPNGLAYGTENKLNKKIGSANPCMKWYANK